MLNHVPGLGVKQLGARVSGLYLRVLDSTIDRTKFRSLNNSQYLPHRVPLSI